jgi:hypothetical protein
MYAETLKHNNKEYEVRVITDGLSVFVRVFHDGKQANALRYEATLESVHDAAAVSGLDIVKSLIATAKSDITKLEEANELIGCKICR